MKNMAMLSVYAAVALLAEGVDRNPTIASWGINKLVALLAEGVDRNSLVRKLVKGAEKSPSSRRAWIEICNG